MTMNTTYQTIRLRPSRLQFVADNLCGMVCLLVLLGLAGCEDLMPDFILPFLYAASALLVALFVCRFIYLMRMCFIITDEQLKYEYGVFSTQRDFIELYRIVDYSEQRTFFQMLLGLKTVSIYSGDRTCPRLDIIGVSNDTDLIRVIRERVEYNKQKRNIHEFTNIH